MKCRYNIYLTSSESWPYKSLWKVQKGWKIVAFINQLKEIINTSLWVILILLSWCCSVCAWKFMEFTSVFVKSLCPVDLWYLTYFIRDHLISLYFLVDHWIRWCSSLTTSAGSQYISYSTGSLYLSFPPACVQIGALLFLPRWRVLHHIAISHL